MIRKLTIIFVTITILASISIVEQIFVKRITDNVLEQAKGIAQAIREQRFDEAMQIASAMDKQWDRQAKMMEVLVDHGSTDEVRYAFSRLLAALEMHDSATAMVYACELEGAIEHVYERQAMTTENIL